MMESKPIRNKSESDCSRLESSSQKRARVNPISTSSLQLLFGRADGDDEPDPAPHFAFSQNGHGVANGLDFEGKSEERRIQIAQQAVGNRGFLFEHVLEFAHIDFRTGDHFEQAHIVQAAGGNFAADDEFGAAEKISLEINEAHVAGLMKLVGRFEFFRQHLALWRAEPAHHAGAFLGPWWREYRL